MRSLHAGNWLLFLLPLIFICFSAHADWTIMVYKDADNNLEAPGIADFIEIADVGSDASVDVDIVILFDRIDGYDATHGDWTGARYGLVNNGDTPTAAWGADWGTWYVSEPNMADPQTVIDFVTKAAGDYPSANYALILWNHGGGWRSRQVDKKKDGPVKAICWDDTNGDGSGLEMDELQTALTAIVPAVVPSINLIGFDACNMSMLEVAYEIRTFGEVMVGSEEAEPGGGWPYDTILWDLVGDPTMDAATLGTAIVDRYYASYGEATYNTQAAIDLAQVGAIATATDNFAQALIADHTVEAPIRAAAANVKAAITAAVINEQHGTSWPGSHGLSIYFPSTVGGYDGNYPTVIDFSVATQWDDFLTTDYYPNMSGTWIETAREESQAYINPAFIDLYDFCTRLDYPYITTASPLPDGDVGTAYSTTIAAAGGETPYQWSVPDYAESDPGAGWAGGGTPKFWQGDEQCWFYSLPFIFTYYGANYNGVYVCDNGYLDFADPVPDWFPSTAGLISSVRIAPLWDDLVTDGGGSQDIYITEAAGQVTIRWDAETYAWGDPVNVEVVLYQTGDIKFNYGAAHSGIMAAIGVSSGDGSRYTLSTRHGAAGIQANVSSLFGPNALPPGLSINAGTGEISGTPTVKGAYNFSVYAVDSDQHTQTCSKAFAMNVTGPPIVEFNTAASSAAESVTSVNLAVSLDEAGTVPITVDYDVTGGTATGGGVDYTLVSGTLTFIVGDLTENIPITIEDEGLPEVNETIQVTLSNPVGATLGATTMHTYTIGDNDTVIVSIVPSKSSIRVSEGKTAAFGVKLASNPVVSVTVNVARTAGEPSINVTGGSTLVFNSSNWGTRQTVTLSASEDSSMEENSATITCSGTNLISATVTATKYDNDRMRPIGGGGCFIAAAWQHR